MYRHSLTAGRFLATVRLLVAVNIAPRLPPLDPEVVDLQSCTANRV